MLCCGNVALTYLNSCRPFLIIIKKAIFKKNTLNKSSTCLPFGCKENEDKREGIQSYSNSSIPNSVEYTRNKIIKELDT